MRAPLLCQSQRLRWFLQLKRGNFGDDAVSPCFLPSMDMMPVCKRRMLHRMVTLGQGARTVRALPMQLRDLLQDA